MDQSIKEKTIIPTRVYNIEEAAELLGMNVRILRQYCNEGKIKARKIGEYKILGESIMEFLKNGDTTVNKENE